MSKFTVFRVDVDSDVLERALGATPGVEVVDSHAADSEPEPGAADPAEPSDDGLLDSVRPEGELLDVETTSAVTEYGLLGLGVSLVVLGIATVGIWWYRRRNSDHGEPQTEFERGTDPVGLSTAAGTAESDEPTSDIGDDLTGEPRAAESVDVAPLLGVAFLAVSGAVVRRVQGEQG